MTPKEFSIYIKNNTSDGANIQLFNTVYQAFINGDVTFTWDITNELYNNKDRVSMSYTALDGSWGKTIVVEGSFTTPQSVVQALNSMGIGFFYLVEIGGVVLIKTDTILYVYGDLDIYRVNNQPPIVVGEPPARFQASYLNNPMVIGVGFYDFDGDPISISLSGNPAFVSLTNVITNGGVFAAEVTCNPNDISQVGQYSFSIIASDGMDTVTFPVILDVLNSSTRAVAQRPYNNIFIKSVSDNTPVLYPCNPSAPAPQLVSTVQYTDPSGFAQFGMLGTISAGNIRVRVEPLDAIAGEYIFFFYNGNGDPGASSVCSDTLILKATLTD